ncbi:MAG: hypothetical protein SVR94_15985 [Pseudomonadota bacterium]|nr:hypothetical protein [Pseudomonadota bacterium]
MNDENNYGSWFKWAVGSIIALIAAGGGLVAILNYYDNKRAEDNLRYQQALEEWNNFSPESITGGVQEVKLRGADRFDLETGRFTSNPEPGFRWDLQFVCGTNAREAMRVPGDNVAWHEFGVLNFESIKYRELRDANYISRRHNVTNYYDLYYAHKSNVPQDGYTFAVKTTDDNVALVQIAGYESIDPNPEVCRNVELKYDVYPIVDDPPKPSRN